MQVLLTTQLILPASYALLTNTGVMALWMILLPIAGILSDRMGAVKLMSLSALAVMLSAYPLFLLLEFSLSLKTVLCVQGILTLAGVGLMGGLPGFIPQLFSVGERVSGTAVGLSLGQALISGITPLVATALVTWTGDFKAPAFYLMFTSLVGYIAVKGAGILMSPKKRADLSSRDLTHSHLAT
jgi:MHS family proline/betaine transporter-like MFS transporter